MEYFNTSHVLPQSGLEVILSWCRYIWESQGTNMS